VEKIQKDFPGTPSPIIKKISVDESPNKSSNSGEFTNSGPNGAFHRKNKLSNSGPVPHVVHPPSSFHSPAALSPMYYPEDSLTSTMAELSLGGPAGNRRPEKIGHSERIPSGSDYMNNGVDDNLQAYFQEQVYHTFSVPPLGLVSKGNAHSSHLSYPIQISNVEIADGSNPMDYYPPPVSLYSNETDNGISSLYTQQPPQQPQPTYVISPPPELTGMPPSGLQSGSYPPFGLTSTTTPGAAAAAGGKNNRFGYNHHGKPAVPAVMVSSMNGKVVQQHTAMGNHVGGIIRSNLLEEFRTSKNNKKYELKDIIGHFIEFSGDQHGSRFIQQKLEISSVSEKNIVFKEIYPAALCLMTDVFGNYVIQKFFEHGTVEHKRLLGETLVGNICRYLFKCMVVELYKRH